MYSTVETYSVASKEVFIAAGFIPVIAGSSPLPSLTIRVVGSELCPLKRFSLGPISKSNLPTFVPPGIGLGVSSALVPILNLYSTSSCTEALSKALETVSM